MDPGKTDNLQNHEISSGSPGRPPLPVAAVLVVFVACAAVAWVNSSLNFNGFMFNDSHDYCQLARNVYEGNGFSTSVLRPLSYKYFQTLPQPETMRMPLYPMLLALGFHVFGPDDTAVVIINGACLVLLGLFSFLLAVDLTQDLRLGFLAAALTVCSRPVLGNALEAEPNILYAALVTAFVYFFLRHPRRTLLAGIGLGLLYLVRFNTVFLLAGMAFVVAAARPAWRERLRSLAILGAGFAIAILPYLVRNALVTGSPFFSLYRYNLLLFTESFPEFTIWTQIPGMDALSFIVSHPGEMGRKFLTSIGPALADMTAFYGPVLLVLSSLVLGLPAREPLARTVKALVLFTLLVQTLIVIPAGLLAYYYLFFVPLIMVMAACAARQYIPLHPVLALGLALVAVLASSVPYWTAPRKTNYYPQLGRAVSAITSPRAIIVTDTPWEISWYAHRRTMWLPHDLKTLERISATLRPHLLVLSGFEYAPSENDLWRRIYAEPAAAREAGFMVINYLQTAQGQYTLLYKRVAP